jgi:hypothetical protein
MEVAMFSISQALLDGVIFSAVISAILLASMVINPRVWLQDYPAAIRDSAPPLTPNEQRVRLAFVIPLLLSFVVVPSVLVQAKPIAQAGFLNLFVHLFIVFNLFNLVDAVVIDWVFLGLMHPKFALVPEAWGKQALLMDKRKAVADWVKGVVICTIFALIMALVITLVITLVGGWQIDLMPDTMQIPICDSGICRCFVSAACS